MEREIGRISQEVLPNFNRRETTLAMRQWQWQWISIPTVNRRGTTEAIQQWMRSVLSRVNHCTSEHNALLREAATLLELALALWKANLDDHGGERNILLEEGVQRTRKRQKRARTETCRCCDQERFAISPIGMRKDDISNIE